jgi:hypothetical protein
MNVIPFVQRIIGHKAGDTQYMEAGQPTPPPYPFYMDTGFILLSANMPQPPTWPVALALSTVCSSKIRPF